MGRGRAVSPENPPLRAIRGRFCSARAMREISLSAPRGLRFALTPRMHKTHVRVVALIALVLGIAACSSAHKGTYKPSSRGITTTESVKK
jgi:hypothetical protein